MADPYRAPAEVEQEKKPAEPKMEIINGGHLQRLHHRCATLGYFSIFWNRIKEKDVWTCTCKQKYYYSGVMDLWHTTI
jgi:hypothetical protein